MYSIEVTSIRMDSIQITAIIIACLFLIAAVGSALQYLEKKNTTPCRVVKFESPKMAMYKSLTVKERDLYGLLHTVKGDSPYHNRITDVLESADITGFRELIKEWQEQAADHPEMVKNIIGVCAFSRVMDLQSSDRLGECSG